MVDVHRVGEFQEVQRNLRFLEGKTEYGYSIKQPIRGRVMMRWANYLPDDNRREDLDELIRSYNDKLEYALNQKDAWKEIRHEITHKRQTKIMLKVLK